MTSNTERWLMKCCSNIDLRYELSTESMGQVVENVE